MNWRKWNTDQVAGYLKKLTAEDLEKFYPPASGFLSQADRAAAILLPQSHL